jgi:hypothetical protein
MPLSFQKGEPFFGKLKRVGMENWSIYIVYKCRPFLTLNHLKHSQTMQFWVIHFDVDTPSRQPWDASKRQ